MERGLEPGCTVPVHLMFVIVTVNLRLFMVIAACEYLRFSIVPQMHLTVLLDALYIMYSYHCTLPSRSQHSSSPAQIKSSPKSLLTSTPVRRSPFSPFKPKSKASTKSLRHGRPWRSTNILNHKDRPRLRPALRLALLKRLVQHRPSGIFRVQVCDQVPLAQDDATRLDRREFESGAGA